MNGSGALIAASMMALSGCVSANGDIAKLTPTAAEVEAAAADPTSAAPVASTRPSHSGAYRDPALVSAANPYGVSVPRQHMPTAASSPADLGSVVMQPTGINAGKSSIFSTQATPVADSGTASAPAYVQTPGVNAAFSSVFSAPAQAAAPEPAVAPKKATAPNESSQNLPHQKAKDDSVKIATIDPATAALAQRTAAADPKIPVTTTAAAEPPANDSGQVPDPKPLTLAAFFAAGSKKNPKNQRGDGDALTPRMPAAKPVETASLAANALVDLKGPVTAMSDEVDDEADDAPTGLMKLVSLPSLTGLTRLAPNGLLVQTDHVNTNCFKPAMVNKIKSIEAHFGKPAIVTSGFRETNDNRRAGGASHSMHTSCQAADIQVEGVSKTDLAGYLRSLPDRGGVGTYCHTQSVHIDTGEARDWNWRCRRMASRR
jgi:uncharacterized protein YcbK (DUF882 family)